MEVLKLGYQSFMIALREVHEPFALTSGLNADDRQRHLNLCNKVKERIEFMTTAYEKENMIMKEEAARAAARAAQETLRDAARTEAEAMQEQIMQVRELYDKLCETKARREAAVKSDLKEAAKLNLEFKMVRLRTYP